jgi:hypothetical protein
MTGGGSAPRCTCAGVRDMRGSSCPIRFVIVPVGRGSVEDRPGDQACTCRRLIPGYVPARPFPGAGGGRASAELSAHVAEGLPHTIAAAPPPVPLARRARYAGPRTVGWRTRYECWLTNLRTPVTRPALNPTTRRPPAAASPRAIPSRLHIRLPGTILPWEGLKVNRTCGCLCPGAECGIILASTRRPGRLSRPGLTERSR